MQEIHKMLSNPRFRLVFAGVGNVLRNDDGVGPYIARRIHEKENRVVYIPESCMDRYIYPINQANPDALIIFDCAEMGKLPGYWEAISVENISDTTCHSHNLSLKKLGEFIQSPVWVIGVQPLNTDVGEHISTPVMHAAGEIIASVNNH